MTSLRPDHGSPTEAMRTGDARLAQLAESGVVGMCVGNVHGDIFDANDAFLALLGFSRDDVDAGTVKWSERTPPEWAEPHRAALDALKRTGTAQPWEAELFHKNGHRVPVMIGVATLDYPNTIAVVTDLTAIRRSDDALLRAERRLQHAHKMEALASLAGGVAHEFNNLLSVILGYTGMLTADLAVNDPMVDILAEIRTAGERAAALTRQLLTLSRHRLAHAVPVDVNDVIAAAIPEVRRRTGDAVEVVVETTTPIPSIFSDFDRLRDALVELAANARDAMPDGGTLRIRTTVVSVGAPGTDARIDIARGEYIVLAVSDTGRGMDRATQARMFEPFFTTKGIGEGTGLGLSTVFGIVQQSGGSIRAASTLGSGTTFRLYFPVASGHGEAPRHAADESATPTVGGTETILIVEDEEGVRSLAARALRSHGYTVIEAAAPGDAISTCQRYGQPIHLVLADVILPRTTGREVVERLRTIRPDLGVLYMSAYTASAVVRHGVIASDVAFLQKPFTTADLARAVRRALDS
jgi:two-component system, cell cycle sensor histidine kinase and response regulator CckA